MRTETIFDLLIIGGGINGTGIANDAAGRGLSVLLCEQADLASGTSCKSSKLIHGGLRYLEQGEFTLVQKALREREILLRKAPHIIHPLTFILPHSKQLRPAWIIRLGLFLYDHLSRRTLLAKSKRFTLQANPHNPLKNDYQTAFSYADCYVDDARLVILNAVQAAQKGAIILTRTQLERAIRKKDDWQVTLKNTLDSSTQRVCARVLINAAGPWGEQVLNCLETPLPDQHLALIKGSHIVVPKLYSGEQAYILQQPDKRIVFVIPFEKHYSLIAGLSQV